MKDTNEVINISSEEKGGEVFSSAKIRPKRDDAGAGINRLVISFAANKYKPGMFLMKKKESKD